MRIFGHSVCSKKENTQSNIQRRDTMRICQKCQGSMVMERAVDLEVGLSILYFACLNCGKRQQAEKEPRPLVHSITETPLRANGGA